VAVEISLMLGWWCRPKVWSSWGLLWLSTAQVSNDGLLGTGHHVVEVHWFLSA